MAGLVAATAALLLPASAATAQAPPTPPGPSTLAGPPANQGGPTRVAPPPSLGTTAPPPAQAQSTAGDPAPSKGRRAQVAENLRPPAAETARAVTPPMVDVELPHTRGTDRALKAAVTASGGEVTGEVPGSLVQARVPASALDALAAVPGVAEVRSPININIPDAPVPQAGSVTGVEVAKTLADQWHAAGITGAGIKVGIVDLFDQATWSDGVAAGNVPNINLQTHTFCRVNGQACNAMQTQSTHGNAVAEIVHDMAPGADLYLVYAQSTADLAAAVDWMANQGVTVVNRSQGAPLDGPGNGTGALADVASYAVSRNITWFNSAGNSAGGGYWRGGWYDPDGDGFLNWNGADELLGVSVNPCAIALGFRWSDWGAPSTRTDYDVYIDSNNDGTINASDVGWELDQQQGAPPIEMAAGVIGSCSGGAKVVHIAVRLYRAGSGTAGDALELLVNGGSLEHWSNPFSGTQPISDSANPGVVSVGAIDPALGGDIAYYSSQGPTNDGRTKPDLVAPSCLATQAWGACFNGTSAASPVAAGAAALVRQSGLTVEPATVRAFLASTATDRYTVGVDNVTGYGEVKLPALPPAGFDTGRFNAVTPFRLIDTRFGQGEPGGKVAPGGVVKAKVTGVGPVPTSGVTAVVLNITATQSTAAGYLQAYPHAAATIGGASTLNLDRPSQTVAGLAVVPVGADGKVAVFDLPGSQVIIDVFGYFTKATTARAGRYQALDPARLADTRLNGGAKLPAGATIAVGVAGQGGVPGGGVSAVVVNLTATQSATGGYVQVMPGLSGATTGWSNLNLDRANQTIANLVVVPLDASGAVRLYTEISTHLIVDVMGYYTDDGAAQSTSGLFTPVAPARLRDTRQGGGPVPPRGRLVVSPLTHPVLAGTNAPALMLNVTATQAIAPGFVQVYPTGVNVEGVSSNLNIDVPGQTVPNAVAATLGAAKQFTIYTYGGAHLIADVYGWYTP